jgi:lipopolysaccharide export system protein LptA
MRRVSWIASLVSVLALAGPAAAQLATNSKAPIAIDADDTYAQNKDCVATYVGNVEALQETSRMRTDQLKIFAEPKAGGKGGASNSNSCGDLKRIEAHGSVFYTTPQQRVRGDDAVYEAGPDTITVTGQVVAVQGQNVITGKKMVINNQTGEGHMEGEARGRNQPGRVRTVIYPNQTNSDSGSGSGKSPGAAAGKPH